MTSGCYCRRSVIDECFLRRKATYENAMTTPHQLRTLIASAISTALSVLHVPSYRFGNIKSSPPASNVTHKSTGGIQRKLRRCPRCFVSSSSKQANDAVMANAAADCQSVESSSCPISISGLGCDRIPRTLLHRLHRQDHQIEPSVKGLKKS